MLPSPTGIGLVLVWPTIQVGLLSFPNFGLGQPSARYRSSGWASPNGQAAAKVLGLVTRWAAG